MNIGIAGRSMNTSGGVKEYLEGLCYGLSRIEIPSDVQLFFFMTPDGVAPTYTDAVKIVKAGSSNRFIWDHVTLPRLVKKHDIDVVLHVKNTIPFTVRTPSVVVVHDLLHLLQPEVYKNADALYMQWAMKHSLPRAERIIAISQNTKKDLLYVIPEVQKERIEVVYQDAMPRFDETISEETLLAFRKKFQLPEQFLLFTGSLSPRKNLPRLFEAFAQVQRAFPHHLVITGGKAWKHEELDQKITQLGLTDRVHVIGFVPDTDMPALYQSADAYIYPSIYEGFGIPLLEAFACGTPVISSNTSSLPEVGGDAVFYVDPHNVNDMAQKIQQLLTDTALQDALRQKGYEQRKRFSWIASSKRIMDLLQKCV